MSKYQAGDVVILRVVHPASGVPVRAVLAREIDLMRCVICDDPECYEWSNVLCDDGRWRWHVPECQMKLDRFMSAEGQ